MARKSSGYEICKKKSRFDRDVIAAKHVLTKGEVATILMVSDCHVQSLLANGTLKGHRCNPEDQNSRWNILRSDLVEFMQSWEVDALIPKSWLAETPEAILTRLVAWSESSAADQTDVYAIVDSAKAWLEQTGSR